VTIHPKYKEGAFYLWHWQDEDIETPRNLKEQLVKIIWHGFSGVVVTVTNSRYEFINPKVLRAIAQVSQWAKIRKIQFWFHADPRQVSRTFIRKTDERTQNLLITSEMGQNFEKINMNTAVIRNNQFELHFKYSQTYPTSVIQEKALVFEPWGIEKVYTFQKENGYVLRHTIRDITTLSQFHANVLKGTCDIFGNLNVPDNEDWWVIAFPKFNTSLYDFAGRESNDLLYHFAEDLFDACTHLDGITWGLSQAGYVMNAGCIPVSLSIYNCFKSEFGYDIRNVLYGLVMEMDDGSHIPIRNDYYNLLTNTIFSAQKDFHRMIHSYFKDLRIGFHHSIRLENNARSIVSGMADPWRALESVHLPFIQIEHGGSKTTDLFITGLIYAKSLGLFSKSNSALIHIVDIKNNQKIIDHLIDIMTLYSTQWLIESPTSQRPKKSKPKSKTDTILSYIQNIDQINEQIDHIHEITHHKFPEADVALVYPVQTIICSNLEDSNRMISVIQELIARLTRNHIQLDIISPDLLAKGRLSINGLRIRHRTYKAVLYPYPEIMTPEVLENVSVIDKSGFPILLGGSKPAMTTEGRKIPHVFPISFDPVQKDITPIKEKGVLPLFEVPKNSLATTILQQKGPLFLVCPANPGEKVEGEIAGKNFRFPVQKSNRLQIIRYIDQKPQYLV